jgi:hypothetical protein
MAEAIEESPKDAERYATLWDIAVEASGEIYNAISVIPTPIGIGADMQSCNVEFGGATDSCSGSERTSTFGRR